MSQGERRRVIIGLSIAGVLLVGALLKFTVFNGGGGSKATTSTLTTLPAAGSSDTSTTPTSAATRSTSPPATFDVFATKNPFEPVIIVTPPDTTPSTTPGDGTTPATTPGGGT